MTAKRRGGSFRDTPPALLAASAKRAFQSYVRCRTDGLDKVEQDGICLSGDSVRPKPDNHEASGVDEEEKGDSSSCDSKGVQLLRQQGSARFTRSDSGRCGEPRCGRIGYGPEPTTGTGENCEPAGPVPTSPARGNGIIRGGDRPSSCRTR